MRDGAGLGLVSPHCLLRRLTAHASIFIPKLLTLNFIPAVQDYAPSFFPLDPITYSTFLCTLHSTPNSRWPKLSLKVASPNPGFPEVKLTIMYLLEYIPLFIISYLHRNLDPGFCSISISTLHRCYLLLILPSFYLYTSSPSTENASHHPLATSSLSPLRDQVKHYFLKKAFPDPQTWLGFPAIDSLLPSINTFSLQHLAIV